MGDGMRLKILMVGPQKVRKHAEITTEQENRRTEEQYNIHNNKNNI